MQENKDKRQVLMRDEEGYGCSGFHRISKEDGASFDEFGTEKISRMMLDQGPYVHIHMVFHDRWC
jgi:hypothetical protein